MSPGSLTASGELGRQGDQPIGLHSSKGAQMCSPKVPSADRTEPMKYAVGGEGKRELYGFVLV